MNDFTYLLRVRYSECDAQKVVFNAKYAEYIRAIWGHYNTVLSRGLDCQVVNLNVSWKASAKFDDVLAINAKTSSIGTSSYAFKFCINNPVTAEQVATAEIVYVMVDTQHYRKIEIPSDLKKKLKDGAPGLCVNHSGMVFE